MRSSSLLGLVLFCGATAPAVALQVGPPQLVTKAVSGGASIGFCGSVTLSRTGRYITFSCLAGDLVNGDTNNRADTFWIDRQTAQVRRVSLNAANAEQVNHSFLGYPSNDGAFAVFEGEGMFHPDVVSAPGVGDRQIANVFLRDFLPPATLLLTRSASGEGNPERAGVLLRDVVVDQSEILFSSVANYVNDTDALPASTSELFSRNWQSGVVERISARPDGGQSAATATLASYSADGRYVVFLSRATDVTGDNPLGLQQLFLRDRESATTTRLTRPWQGGEFDASGPFGGGPSYQQPPRLAANGRLVAFQAALNDEFVADDNVGVADIYLLDRQSNTTELISRARGSESADGSSSAFDISEDGDTIAFFTRATNILAGVASPAIYLKSRSTGAIVNVTQPFGELSNTYTPWLDLSEDGSTLSFTWRVNNPALPDLNGRTLVYTVSVRGAADVVPVPAMSLLALLSMMVLLGAGARVGIARRQHA